MSLTPRELTRALEIKKRLEQLDKQTERFKSRSQVNIITLQETARGIPTITGNLPEIEYRYQREIGQDRNTVLLVVLATGCSTQAISSISSLEGWGQRWWEPVVWMVTGWLSYRWTVRRTKYEHRK